MVNSVSADIFSNRLRALMLERRVKGIDLAAALDVRAQTITGWRNGTYLPDQSKWDDIANYFDVPTEALFLPSGTDINQAAPNQAPTRDTTINEPAPSYPKRKRGMRLLPPYGGSTNYGLPNDSNGPKISREKLEAEIKHYLDCAEAANALAVAALAIRKHLDAKDFEYFDE